MLNSTVLMILYLAFYPRASPWRAGFGTSSQIIGSWYGCCLGLGFVERYMPDVKSELVGFLRGNLRVDVPRFIAATIIVAITKVITKSIGKTFLLFLHNRGFLLQKAEELRDIYGKSVEAEKTYWVEVKD